MRIIKVKPDVDTIPLGRQGETHAEQVRFPVSAFGFPDPGAGSFRLIHQRAGDAAPYPVAIAVDGGEVCWDVSDSDTANSGTGRCELQYYSGDALAKSRVWSTRVAPALSAAGPDPPPPYQSWVDEVLAAGNSAEAAAARAEAAAIRQPIIGDNGNWWTWDADAGAYTDTGMPASGGGTPYEGEYEVVPNMDTQTLETADKSLDRNIVVKAIPVYRTENPSGGNTIIIGG